MGVSGIAGAGCGLFATRSFGVHELVCAYAPFAVCHVDASVHPLPSPSASAYVSNEYIMGVDGCWVDGSDVNSGFGRFVNDGVYGQVVSQRRVNAVFCVNHISQRIELCTKQSIAVGDEILVSYGTQYWKHWKQQKGNIAVLGR